MTTPTLLRAAELLEEVELANEIGAARNRRRKRDGVTLARSNDFIRGTAVLRSGEHTDARPGRFVKGPGWKA